MSSGRGAAVGLEKKARTAGLPPRRIYLHSVCIYVTNLPTTDGDGLFETQEFDPASGAARARGTRSSSAPPSAVPSSQW